MIPAACMPTSLPRQQNRAQPEGEDDGLGYSSGSLSNEEERLGDYASPPPPPCCSRCGGELLLLTIPQETRTEYLLDFQE